MITQASPSGSSAAPESRSQVNDVAAYVSRWITEVLEGGSDADTDRTFALLGDLG